MGLIDLPTKQDYKGLTVIYYCPDIDADVCWGVVRNGSVLAQELSTEEEAYAWCDGFLEGLKYAN